jgi:hypothetical protein
MNSGLSAYGRASGPQWYVIGVRLDGSRLVLAQSRTECAAGQVRDAFATCLEGYTSIVVEPVGDISACRVLQSPPSIS